MGRGLGARRPENPGGPWLHRPGNLTLSGYNPSLWNHPFLLKREYYAKSNIVITRELAAYEQWTEAEIRQRGSKLAKEAAGIWIGPKEPVAAIEAGGNDAEGTGPRQELRGRFWRGLNDYLVAEYPALPDFEPVRYEDLRLPSGVRHVTIHLHFNLRHQYAGVDVGFWKPASQRVFEAIRQSPKSFNTMVGAEWEFEHVSGGPRGRMLLNREFPDLRDESSWAGVYEWIGKKLSLVYEHVTPKLRDAVDETEQA